MRRKTPKTPTCISTVVVYQVRMDVGIYDIAIVVSGRGSLASRNDPLSPLCLIGVPFSCLIGEYLVCLLGVTFVSDARILWVYRCTLWV